MSRGVYEVEHRLRVADGSWRHFHARAAPVTTQDGAVREWVGVHTDITERKRAEATLQEQAEMLETLNRVGQALSAELKLDRLVQSVTDAGVELTGAQFGAFFYNHDDDHSETHMLYTLSGAPKEAFERFPLPRTTRLFGPTFRGEGVVRVADVTEDARYGRNAPHAGMPPGHLPVRSYLAVPVTSRSGEVLGAMLFGHPQPGVFSERTEQLVLGLAAQTAVALDNAHLHSELQQSHETLESRVRQRTQELQRVNADLEAFAYSASHDLRTPVRHVGSFAGVLRSNLQDGASERNLKLLRMIEDAAERMNTLIDALLTFSRLGRQDLHLQPVPLRDLTVEVIDELAPDAAGREVRWELGELPTVLGDRELLRQVLLNILQNALKYTRQREEALIAVWAEEGASDHVIHVRDNGVGFDPAYREKLFEAFQRLHRPEEFEGSGLGLANVNRILQRHGGQVWAEGEVGRGATFHFSLPRAP